MIARIVSLLLHVANSHPHYPTEVFYAMKERLCRRFGKLVGHDTQFITRPCFGNWDPARDYWGGCTKTAECKCGGNGVFDFYWVTLERWEVGGRLFHRPIARHRLAPGSPVTIHGRVEHRSYGKWSLECQMWLAIFFDRPHFWQLFHRGGHYMGFWMPPLCFLQMLWDRGPSNVRRALKPYRCFCGRTYRHWFSDRGWCICRKCRKKDYVDGVPF